MKQHLKLYLVVGLIALLMGARAVQSVQAASDSNGVTSAESSQASAAVAQAPTVGDTSTTGIPSLEDRVNILNEMNKGIPITLDGNVQVAGPQPGTESGPAGLVKPPLSPQSNSGQGTVAASAQSNGSQGTVVASTGNILSQTLGVLTNWFSGLLKSIFNA